MNFAGRVAIVFTLILTAVLVASGLNGGLSGQPVILSEREAFRGEPQNEVALSEKEKPQNPSGEQGLQQGPSAPPQEPLLDLRRGLSVEEIYRRLKVEQNPDRQTVYLETLAESLKTPSDLKPIAKWRDLLNQLLNQSDLALDSAKIIGRLLAVLGWDDKTSLLERWDDLSHAQRIALVLASKDSEFLEKVIRDETSDHLKRLALKSLPRERLKELDVEDALLTHKWLALLATSTMPDEVKEAMTAAQAAGANPDHIDRTLSDSKVQGGSQVLLDTLHNLIDDDLNHSLEDAIVKAKFVGRAALNDASGEATLNTIEQAFAAADTIEAQMIWASALRSYIDTCQLNPTCPTQNANQIAKARSSLQTISDPRLAYLKR